VAFVRLGRALPGARWRSRAFECRAYRQSGTAEIDRRRPKMRPTFFRRARARPGGARRLQDERRRQEAEIKQRADEEERRRKAEADARRRDEDERRRR